MGRYSDRLPSAGRRGVRRRWQLLGSASRGIRKGGIVDSSTTATDWLDAVETGWTEEHVAGFQQTYWTKTATLPR